jgi:four helix bundle protein
MAPISSFKDLKVWRASMDLTDVCFDIVEAIQHPYRFIFANQLLPASIAIPSNIAEGSRRPTKAYLHHLSYWLGSHGEVETPLRAHPTTKTGTGSTFQQRRCSYRPHRKNVASLGRVPGNARPQVTV